MRTSFQDWEDKQLVQIALQFEIEGMRITWAYVARRMAESKRTASQLQLRLNSLKKTYGKTIADFPPCCFSSASRLRPLLLSESVSLARRVPSVVVQPRLPAPTEASLGTSHVPRPAVQAPLYASAYAQLSNEQPAHPTERQPTDVVSTTASPAAERLPCGAAEAAVIVAERAANELAPGSDLELSTQEFKATLMGFPELLPVLQPKHQNKSCKKTSTTSSPKLLTLPAVTCAMESIFGDISAKDVRQHADRMHNNAGELLPSGIAVMMDALEPLTERDIFLDMGAGIGNVLAQVALATKVSKCIGVEVRGELFSLGTERMLRNVDMYPLLRKVFLKSADVRDLLLSAQPPTCDATIIFANNFLFEETAKIFVARAK
ncbi:hypothetical protein PF005_g10708 [Phytophthora fragariae]|uniref:Histone-lysine N-methyltransferase, H3 lysine-79 specific n=2 Tax=Phytophthora fragariae TaxID=53985 RepID=A0A6A3KUD5_9STRA|nr:hypothetical protein PF003_g36365 [Phytophthora fragariae]KAE8938133.1 hypothetical protein PF009_g11973 [Phytophthora fragariae]KAE9011116.1 hypothetical protein PF011_g9512 [Phytophthora fragariae]KAE9113745.1 hypothetical protein PF007_g10630 [Phytophthora fragariae]KAE9115058.1 hypothetical protein PF010_g9487 [Phytophthora fragariae]